VSRQEALAEGIKATHGFLVVLVAEAAHLDLPVPEDVRACLSSLKAWEQQLTSRGSPPIQEQSASVHAPLA
jgi:hypothetical protein